MNVINWNQERRGRGRERERKKEQNVKMTFLLSSPHAFLPIRRIKLKVVQYFYIHHNDRKQS